MASVSRMNKKVFKCPNNFLNEYRPGVRDIVVLDRRCVHNSDNHESGFGNPELDDRSYSYVRRPEQFASWFLGSYCIWIPARSGSRRTCLEYRMCNKSLCGCNINHLQLYPRERRRRSDCPTIKVCGLGSWSIRPPRFGGID
jgi:hypothetical protein